MISPSLAQDAFRSTGAGGDWNSNTTWEVATTIAPYTWAAAAPGQYPTAQDTAYLEAGTTVSLTGDESVADLHLNSTIDVIRLNTGDNTLDLHGKIRIYREAAPGTKKSGSAGVQGWINTGTAGKLRFVSNGSRFVVRKGEFGAKFENANTTVEFAFNEGDTAYIDETVRFGNITVSSGVVRVLDDHTLRPTEGTARTGVNDGKLFVRTGATLYAGWGIYRNKSTAIDSLVVEPGATLAFSYRYPELSVNNLVLDGTLELAGTDAIQLFPQTRDRFGANETNSSASLRLGGTATKTLTTSSFTATDTLELAGTFSEVDENGYTFSAATATLSYDFDQDFTTTEWEFPSDGPLPGLVIKGAGEISLNASKSVSGNVTVQSGALLLGDHDLTLGLNGSGSGQNNAFVIQNGAGRMRRVVDGLTTVTFPFGTAYDSVSNTEERVYSPLTLTFTGGSFTEDTITVTAVDQYPQSIPNAVDSLSRYWVVDIPSNLESATYSAVAQYSEMDISGLHGQLGGYQTGSTAPVFGGVADTTVYQISLTGLRGSGLITGYSECGVLDNTISTTGPTLVCPDESFPLLNGSTPNISGDPIYIWEVSFNGQAFSPISGGNGEDFSPEAEAIAGSYAFRRGVTSETCLAGTLTYTDTLTVTVDGYANCFPGVVAYYTMDGCEDINTTNAVDGVEAVITGGAVKAGFQKQGIGFNGSADYLNLGNDPQFDFTGGFSASLWVKTSKTNNRQYLLNKENGVDGAGYWIEINNGVPRVRFPGLSNAGPYAAASNISDGTWHHIVASYEAGVVQLWVDGTLEQEQTGLSGLIYENAGSDTWLGARTTGSRYFQGTLDEVRLYSYALTPAEVATLASATENSISCQEPNSLIGYWAMEDIATTTVFDSAQNQAVGGLLNGATYGPGQVGNGVILDGIDDGIDLGDNAWDLGPNDAFTWSLWVQPNSFGSVQSLLRRITNGRSLRLEINRNGFPRVYLGGLDNPGWYVSNMTLNAGEWNHLVLAYENGTLTWQINGVAGTPVTGLTGLINLGSGYTLAGRRNNNRRPGGLAGGMDEIRFYNYALSAAEMDALYATLPNLMISNDMVGQPTPLQEVSHYRFDDCGSLQSEDDHLINPGALRGTTRSAGYLGGGLAFDGTNAHVNLGNNPSLNFEGAFSFTLWVNTTVNREQDIIVAKNKAGNSYSYMLANRYGYPALYLGSAVQPTEWISTERYIADGQWHHLAVVIGKGTAYVYVDGTLAVSRTGLQGSVAVNAEADTWLGGVSHNSRHAFTGSLDEVRFYSAALPITEIRQQAQMVSNPTACDTPAGRGIAPISEEPQEEISEFVAWSTYPNPTTGRFVLAAPKAIREQVYVQVLNLQGQVVYTYLGSIAQRELAIDLSDEATGMYIVQVRNGKEQQTLKVQVE